MGRILTHDAVAAGIFNKEYSSGQGVFSSWESQLRNSAASLELLCNRIGNDYITTMPKLRKAFGAKEAES